MATNKQILKELETLRAEIIALRSEVLSLRWNMPSYPPWPFFPPYYVDPFKVTSGGTGDAPPSIAGQTTTTTEPKEG